MSFGQTDCSGLWGPDAANCVIGNIGGAGWLDPGILPDAEDDVPGYAGTPGCRDAGCAGASETQYYRTDGDTTQMSQDGIDDRDNDPVFNDVQWVTNEADNRWPDPSLMQPAVTAADVADAMTDNPPDDPTQETCENVPVCIEVEENVSIEVCQSPGVELVECPVTVSQVNTIVDTTPQNPPIPTAQYCGYGFIMVRATEISRGVIKLEWSDSIFWETGYDPDYSDISHEFYCIDHHNSFGIGFDIWHDWGTIVLDLPTDYEIMTEEFEVWVTGNEWRNCFYPTNPFRLPVDGVARNFLDCNGAYDFWVTGTMDLAYVDVRASYLEVVKFDGCAPVRPGRELFDEWCTDNVPRNYNDPLGGSVVLNPPAEWPFNSCWNKVEQWVSEVEGEDTCLPYQEAGCVQTFSECLVDNGQNCLWFEKTFECNQGNVCVTEKMIEQCTSCGTPGSIVPYCSDVSTPPNDKLLLAATYLAIIDEAQDDWDESTLTLFNGEGKGCKYDNFGQLVVNCCDADPDRLLGVCPDEAVELAQDRKAKKTHYVGTRCSSEFLFLCLEKEEVYCSFKGMLPRIVHEQGRPTIPRDWGSADDPDCDGFRYYEFANLDWESMDLSEYFSEVEASIDEAQITDDMEAEIDACLNDPSTCDRVPAP